MKRTTLKSSFAAGLTSLLLLFHGFGCVKESTLTDISKPYLGEYECTQAQYGDTDYLEMFSYLRIEFTTEETYTLHYQMTNGKPKRISGKYSYDKETETITMQAEEFGTLKKKFSLKEGVFTVRLEIGQKELIMKFDQK